ncbi:hypothetical protein KQI89_17555, partial [Clostridium sp. MSJ-4]
HPKLAFSIPQLPSKGKKRKKRDTTKNESNRSIQIETLNQKYKVLNANNSTLYPRVFAFMQQPILSQPSRTS